MILGLLVFAVVIGVFGFRVSLILYDSLVLE